MSITVNNVVYDQKWIEALIKGSKNLISPETDYILQTLFYEVRCNMNKKQPHYKATLNAINSDLLFCLSEGSLHIPDTYIKMFGLGKDMHQAKFIHMPKWKRGFSQ